MREGAGNPSVRELTGEDEGVVRKETGRKNGKTLSIAEPRLEYIFKLAHL